MFFIYSCSHKIYNKTNNSKKDKNNVFRDTKCVLSMTLTQWLQI